MVRWSVSCTGGCGGHAGSGTIGTACMQPRACECMQGCMHGWLHACMHACMDCGLVRGRRRMHACMHPCMHACTCIRAQLHALKYRVPPSVLCQMERFLFFKTFSNGCLGSRIDEGRSEMRYALWIADFSEPSDFWTHMALLGYPSSTSVSVSFDPFKNYAITYSICCVIYLCISHI